MHWGLKCQKTNVFKIEKSVKVSFNSLLCVFIYFYFLSTYFFLCKVIPQLLPIDSCKLATTHLWIHALATKMW